MTQLDLEIGKICAFSGAEEIVRADIDAVVEPTLEAVVFQITDALGQGRFDRNQVTSHGRAPDLI